MMSKPKVQNQRKLIAFILIVVLIIGGVVSTPITSMASNDSAVKVTYRLSGDSKDDIKVDIPLEEQSGKGILTQNDIPDDPKGSGHETFLGWKHLNAKSQSAKDKLWTKADLIGFTVSEETDFSAVFEKEDSKEEEKTQNQEPDKKQENKPSKKNKGSIGTQAVGDIKLYWGSEGTKARDINENVTEELTLALQATSLSASRSIVISFENKNPAEVDNIATDTGFDLDSFDLPNAVKSHSYDTKAKTLTCELDSTYSNSTLSLSFKAKDGHVYKEEEVFIKAKLIENGSEIADDSVSAKALIKNNNYNTLWEPVDPSLIKGGVGEGFIQQRLTTGTDASYYNFNGAKIDLAGMLIKIGHDTYTYEELLTTSDFNAPPIVFYYEDETPLDDNGSGSKTILNIQGDGITTFSNHWNKIKYKTTSDFKNASLSLRGSGSDMGVGFEYYYKKSKRGKLQITTQTNSGITLPDNTGAIIRNSGTLLKSSDDEVIPYLAPGVAKATTNNYEFLQPNSVDSSVEYFKKAPMFSAYFQTTRTAEEAETAEDDIIFEIPNGMEITDIILPSNLCEYKSIMVEGDSTEYFPDDVISFATPRTGNIKLTIKGLNYINYTSSNLNYFTDKTKIIFVGQTRNLASGNHVFKASSGTASSSITMKTLGDDEVRWDPAVSGDANYIKDSNSSSRDSFVKGESYYLETKVGASNYSFSSTYFENSAQNGGPSGPIFAGPVAYIDIAPGMTIEDATINGRTTGYNGQQLGVTISGIFPNEGKWGASGGAIVEVKIIDKADPSKIAVLNTQTFTNIKLKINIPENYDDITYGNTIPYSSNDMRWTTYDPNAIGLGTTSPRGQIINNPSIPSGGVATVKNMAVVHPSESAKNLNIVMSASASINGAVRVAGGTYKIYDPGDPTTMPERPAGSKNEMFSMSVNYGLQDTVNNGKAYFVLPKGDGWAPSLNGRPTINMNGINNSEIKYYYSTKVVSDSNTLDTNGDITGFTNGDWILFNPDNVAISALENVTAIKFEFDQLDKGDQFNMYMPYELPTVGGNVQYGKTALGKTYYHFDSIVNGDGGMPALQLVKSDKPILKDNNNNNIPSEEVKVDFGNASALPDWNKAVTYDDFTDGIKLDKVIVKYKEQSPGSTNSTVTISGSSISTAPFSPGTINNIDYKDGFKNTISNPTDYISATKPGTYEITYITTNDDDTQTSSAIRKIKVEKTVTNSLKTTDSSIDFFYDQNYNQVDGSATSWDNLYRSKLQINDLGGTVNVQDTSKVTLKSVTTKDKTYENLLDSKTGAEAFKFVQENPNNYIITYTYKDSYNLSVGAKINATSKYRGDLKAQVKMGSSAVNGASILGSNGTKNTTGDGSATFSYESSTTTPGYIGYYVELQGVPNGYKMPVQASASGILTKDNNDGLTKNVVETFQVSPVAIKAVFQDNATTKYMKSVSLYKGGTLVKTQNITDEGSFIFYPDANQIFDGSYYVKAELKPGYEPSSASDLTGTDVKTSNFSIGNQDLTKTLKIKKSTFKVNYFGVDDHNTTSQTYDVIFMDNIVNGSRPVPSETTKANSYFKGWSTDKAGTNIVDPTTITMGAANINLYEQHNQKTTLTFTAIDAPSVVYNGSIQNATSAVNMSGTLISGHSLKSTLSASGQGEDAKTYEMTFGAVTTSDFNGLGGKAPTYFYKVNYVPGEFVISKKVITVKPKDESRVYNGSVLNASAVEYVNGTSIANADSLDMNATTFDGGQKDVGSTTSSIKTIKIVRGSVDKTSNYDITKQKGSLIVTAAGDMSITAADANFTYDGNNHTVNDATANKNGAEVFYSTSGAVWSKTKPNFEAAGQHKIYIKATHNNYSETSSAAFVNIIAKSISVKPADRQKTYDGTMLSANNATESGIVNGQTLTVKSYQGQQVDAGTTNSSINVSDIVIKSGSVDKTSNYIVTPIKGTLKIDKRDITVKPVDREREYDGTALKAVNSTQSGIAPGQTLNIDSSKYKGSQLDVGTTDSSIDKSDVKIMASTSNKANNYNINTIEGSLKVTLNTKDLGVFKNGTSVKYDGKSHGLKNAYGTIKGNRDNGVTLLYSTSENGTYTKSIPTYTDVGSYPVWIKAEKGNYKSTLPISDNIKISARTLSVKPEDRSKTYDGKELKPNSYILSGDDLAPGQKINVTYSGSRIDAGSSVTKINDIQINSGGTNTKSNYKVSTKDGRLSIDQRAVSVKPDSARKTYDGKALTINKTKIIQGKMANGEILKVTLNGNSRTKAGEQKVTIQEIDVVGGKTSNYMFFKDSGSIVIDPANDTGNTGRTTNGPDDDGVVPPEDRIVPGGGGSDVVERPETVTSVQPTQSNVPSIGIGDTKIPLWAENGTPSWALLNLIFTIAAAIMMLFMAYPIWSRKKEEDRMEQQGYQRQKLFDGKWMLAGLVFATAQVVLFAFTQNLRGMMVIMNMWTIVHVLATALLVISLILAIKSTDQDEEYKFE